MKPTITIATYIVDVSIIVLNKQHDNPCSIFYVYEFYV